MDIERQHIEKQIWVSHEHEFSLQRIRSETEREDAEPAEGWIILSDDKKIWLNDEAALALLRLLGEKHPMTKTYEPVDTDQ